MSSIKIDALMHNTSIMQCKRGRLHGSCFFRNSLYEIV